jgi:glucose uptake protein GlcU
MEQFLLGANVMAASLIGLFFLKFWRKSRDPLFGFFSIAFWLLGVNWLSLAFVNRDEPQTLLYLVRLAAFILILIGIWHKNRTRPGRE